MINELSEYSKKGNGRGLGEVPETNHPSKYTRKYTRKYIEIH
jgi:hypothetical protein